MTSYLHIRLDVPTASTNAPSHLLWCGRWIWFTWPRGEHSAKPDAFYDLVESVSHGPYLELFARRARFGWDYWGDESLGTIEISAQAKAGKTMGDHRLSGEQRQTRDPGWPVSASGRCSQ